MQTNPSWQTSCKSPLKSDKAVITGPKVRLGLAVTQGKADSSGGAWTDWQLCSDKTRPTDRGEQGEKPSWKVHGGGWVGWGVGGVTWRKLMWSSMWESLSSSASFIFKSAISFSIFSSSWSAWLMAVFSWALISSRTSKRFSSMDRISWVKRASLSSATARAERWRETQNKVTQCPAESDGATRESPLLGVMWW